MSDAIQDPLIGKMVDGRYLIEEKIGAGNVGAVYKAKHLSLNKVVAIKALLPQWIYDDAAIKRFFREARAASFLKHPNIVATSDLGTLEDSRPYLVMDYWEGEDLKDYIVRHPGQHFDLAVHVINQIASALDALHEKDLIHRDIKPHNILLVPNDSPEKFDAMLVDFGLASLTIPTADMPKITRQGHFAGTPSYVSPEAWETLELDSRADVYSLATVGYRMLTGSLPYVGTNMYEMLLKKVREEAPSLALAFPDQQVPESLIQAMADGLAKDRDKRIKSAGEFAKRFEKGVLEFSKTFKPPVPESVVPDENAEFESEGEESLSESHGQVRNRDPHLKEAPTQTSSPQPAVRGLDEENKQQPVRGSESQMIPSQAVQQFIAQNPEVTRIISNADRIANLNASLSLERTQTLFPGKRVHLKDGKEMAIVRSCSEQTVVIDILDKEGNRKQAQVSKDDVVAEKSDKYELELEAPPLGQLYGLDQFYHSGEQPYFRPYPSPTWLNKDYNYASADTLGDGLGWGRHLSELLGNRFFAGDMICVSGEPGSGVHEFVMQLVDGMGNQAAHNSISNCVTPVMLLTKNSAEKISLNSLSRWIGYDAKKFRGAVPLDHIEEKRKTSTTLGADEGLAYELSLLTLGNRDQSLSKKLIELGILDETHSRQGRAYEVSRQYIRRFDAGVVHDSFDLLGRVSEAMTAWASKLKKARAEKNKLVPLKIVPVLVVDPLDHFIGSGPQADSAVQLNRFMELLSELTSSLGWITIVTTPSPFLASQDPGFDSPELQKRAIYYFNHYKTLSDYCTSMLYLQRLDTKESNEALIRSIVCKSDWGSTLAPWPRFLWSLDTNRFVAVRREQTEDLHQAEVKRRTKPVKEEPPQEQNPPKKKPKKKGLFGF